jgi:hypothetical protein
MLTASKGQSTIAAFPPPGFTQSSPAHQVLALATASGAAPGSASLADSAPFDQVVT